MPEPKAAEVRDIPKTGRMRLVPYAAPAAREKIQSAKAFCSRVPVLAALVRQHMAVAEAAEATAETAETVVKTAAAEAAATAETEETMAAVAVAMAAPAAIKEAAEAAMGLTETAGSDLPTLATLTVETAVQQPVAERPTTENPAPAGVALS